METSRYPTLDQLERYGLRAAFLILMLGTRSWNHFQTMHDTVIPETCRLPRNLVMALKTEYGRMILAGFREIDDDDLLDEFNRARGSKDLRRFHWELFEHAMQMPEPIEPDPNETIGDRWQFGPPARFIVPAPGKKFRGTWRGLDVIVHPDLASSVGSSTDEDSDDPEAARAYDELYVNIRVEGHMTRARMNTIAAEPRHPSMLRMGWSAPCVWSWFHHELPSHGLGRHIDEQHNRDGERPEVTLTADGIAQLTAALAAIGVTDLRAA